MNRFCIPVSVRRVRLRARLGVGLEVGSTFLTLLTWLTLLTLLTVGTVPLRAQAQEAAGRAPESKANAATSAPTTTTKQARGVPQASAREPASALSGFYRVRPGESLGGIANDLITQEIANSAAPPAEKPSVAQRMLAIYRANPKAFAGSMHQLLDGAELRLPSSQEIAAVDPASARSELRDQTSEYLAEQARAVDITDAAPASEAERTMTSLQHALRRKDRELAALRAELDQLRAPTSNPSASNPSASNTSVAGASAQVQAQAQAQAGAPVLGSAGPIGGGSSLGLPNPTLSRTLNAGGSSRAGVTDGPAAAPGGVFSPSGLALAGGMALLAGLIGLRVLRQRGRSDRKPAFRTSAPAVTEPEGAWTEAEILQRMPDLSGFSGLGSSSARPGDGLTDRPSTGPGRVPSSKGT